MNAKNDACSLAYLAGTMATAYKGVITSLVTKDFCMSDNGTLTKLTGTVLSMPDGDYEASLTTQGVELSRSPLVRGYFEFAADSGSIAAARNLQIDIIQTGRHIGTFLLKKERSGGRYSSAVELSAELAGVDLTRLSLPLRGRVGLLQRAEEIIALLHSTKKDWTALSEKLHGLFIDLFWSTPDVFSGTFDILARFTLLAAERAGTPETSKPLANYFDLLDLALRQQPDRVRATAAEWTSLLARSAIDLSALPRRACETLQAARTAVSGPDLTAVVRSLIASLRRRDRTRAFLDNRILDRLGRAVPRKDVERLGRYGEPGRRAFGELLGSAERQLEEGDPLPALDLVAGLDFEILDEHKALAALFELAEERLSAGSADVFGELFAAVFAANRRPDGRSLTALRRETPVILARFLALRRTDICAALLTTIEESGSLLNDQLLLNPRVADAVLGSGEARLMEQYSAALQRVAIPAARVRGISPDTWAEEVDPEHLGKLTAFLELLGHQDGRLGAVLVHVIANLAAGGVLIPDDRLFQRTVSLYLGSPVLREQFLPSLLLLERLPVYFNEVGAVSRIRDYSTELDAWGNDPVIYFLRKQVHVNASSWNVTLIERVFASWARNDASLLRGFVPPDVLAQSDPALTGRYSAVISALLQTAGAACRESGPVECLLALDDEAFDRLINSSGVPPDREARDKVRLLIGLHRELVGKYAFRSREPAAGDVHTSIRGTVDALGEQKRIMLDPGRSLPEESLYFKRHIAFGIPSVLGTYHERKFDACGAFLRLGVKIKVLFEQMIDEVEGRSAVTGADLTQWLTDLALAWRVLGLVGLQNAQIDEFVQVLEQNRQRLGRAQTADVLRMWQKELAWIVSSLSGTFHGPITEVLRRLPQSDLPEHLQGLDTASPDFTGKAADVVMRDLLSSVPGLVESDGLLHAVLRALLPAPAGEEASPSEGAQDLPPFFVLEEMSAADASRHAPELGNKAKNLVLLRSRGLHVPAGVVLPARHTARFRDVTEDPGYPAVLKEAVKALESATGAEFGGPVRPLFLSVRSGSYPSMPGILSSILYCGMNDATREAFIRLTGNRALGWDSHRRFIEHYAEAVFGLGAPFFEGLAPGLRRRLSSADGQPPSAYALRELTARYRAGLLGRGLTVPDDPYEQLRQCIRAVYASWYSERARQFRSITGTADAWGTAVTLMEMVPGNQAGAGASSFFTRDPVTLEPAVYGETRELACGDDLASGRLSGRPLSRQQAGSGMASLEERDPELFRLHAELARTIEEAFGGLPQEVEATYVRDGSGRQRLSVLQTRRMEHGAVHAESFSEICRMGSRVIGHGTGANGGAVSGRASFARDAAAVKDLRQASGRPVILLRKTADTDDVSLMPHIAGIVTASGGVTSHAAVLAHKFALSAVVACPDMELRRDEQGKEFALLGATEIREGSAISIDGATGLVFSGECLATTTSDREGRHAGVRAQ
jgi:pyruvate,orthophosphate dikinase